MKGKILELLYKDGKNWKVEAVVDWNRRKLCSSYGKICPNSKRGMMPPFAVFGHKAIESDSDEIILKEENFHCYDCANDILWGLETSRSDVIVKNLDNLVILRQELNSLV